MAKRFYTELPLARGAFVLNGPEAHHMLHVSRMQLGEAITLFNGDGKEYPARLISASKRDVELEILEELEVSREARGQLTIACSLPKGDRAAFLVEKLTELGVKRLIPLLSARTIVQPSENKSGKLKRHVMEASKQCGRNVLMEIDQPQQWTEMVHRGTAAQRFMADQSGKPFASPSDQPAIVALGPEGGWTEEELQEGRAAGWYIVKLAPATLRIETAAIAAAVQWLTV